jgi:hypothetical protein
LKFAVPNAVPLRWRKIKIKSSVAAVAEKSSILLPLNVVPNKILKDTRFERKSLYYAMEPLVNAKGQNEKRF